jgi:hypothetical protein
VPKTVTLQDSTVADLLAALGAAQAPGPTPTPTPTPEPTPTPPAPPGVRVVTVPWTHTAGLPNITIMAGEVISFAITPPGGANSNGLLGSFSISPTDQNAYFDRVIALATAPGEFSAALGSSAMKTGQEPSVYFSVGGYPTKTVWGRTYTDTNNADLTAGKTYYVNVKQVDPTRSCRINYGLSPV